MGIIMIGAIAGVVIGLVLALVFVRRRCHLNEKRPKNGGLQVQNGQQIGLQVQNGQPIGLQVQNGQPIGLQVPNGREAQQHKLDALAVTMASSSSSSSSAAAAAVPPLKSTVRFGPLNSPDSFRMPPLSMGRAGSFRV
jgi:hypothetical protein